MPTPVDTTQEDSLAAEISPIIETKKERSIRLTEAITHHLTVQSWDQAKTLTEELLQLNDEIQTLRRAEIFVKNAAYAKRQGR